MPLTGREKATIFLSILGSETSARVLRYLPDELADLIAAGINHLPSPSPEALAEVMNEFQGFLALPQTGTAAPKVSEKPAPPPPPKRSYSILMYERPQMVAYLLSLMLEEQREEALQVMPNKRTIVEELLLTLKKNPVSDKLEAKLKEHYGEKLFAA